MGQHQWESSVSVEIGMSVGIGETRGTCEGEVVVGDVWEETGKGGIKWGAIKGVVGDGGRMRSAFSEIKSLSEAEKVLKRDGQRVCSLLTKSFSEARLSLEWEAPPKAD
jgi:hypothetical protein